MKHEDGKNSFSSPKPLSLIKEWGDDIVLIENPNYIYARYDICPLAPKIQNARDGIVAIVQDMDGTTTTTEGLCLHSLENMVRQYTGGLTAQDWKGLDPNQDYLNIIGNSTTRHVEYLIGAYKSSARLDYFQKAYLKASLLSIAFGRDEMRRREVLSNLKHFGLSELLDDHRVRSFIMTAANANQIFFPEQLETELQKWANLICFKSFADRVRAAIDIYYQRYHEILFYIEHHDYDAIKAALPIDSERLIEPMPGVAIMLALVKGWLGRELDVFADELIQSIGEQPQINYQSENFANAADKLRRIGKYFEQNPVRIAVVTSSIAYEAKIVLKEVFRRMCAQIQDWKINVEKKERLLQKFSDHNLVFDEVITASDSSEIRLKPHRDLYSLALHRLGIAKDDFDKVIGFEDSESGVIAIRAAGVGLCVAVPFADTRSHRLQNASYILYGGLPEAMVVHQLFLNENTLKQIN
ncbi:MAG: hypothetical protein SCK70_09770 [bacterium]|nr:hypothetical protein [bacterium]